MNQETKACQNCKSSFVIESEDFVFYEKAKVPPPTWCSQCRMVRRMIFRNVRSLYRRNCNLCNVSIITMYHPEDPAPVYCNPCWQSDAWEAESYAREIDWSRPFFEQWQELYREVPRFALWKIGTLLNSEYTNYSGNNKDCYLSYSVVDNENIRYSENVDRSRTVIDSLYIKECEGCYENIDCVKNYNSLYMVESWECIDSAFLFDCANCQNCFMSANLRNRQYVFRGKQLAREEYNERIKEEISGSHTKFEELKAEFKQVAEKAIHRYAQILNSSNATGNNISNSKNIRNSFSVYSAEEVVNSIRVLAGAKEVVDSYGAGQGELIYECVATGFGGYRNLFSFLCDVTKEIQYSAFCQNASNLFGCVGMKNKQYCILNKEYSKEEHVVLVKKIIEHMNAMPYRTSRGAQYRYGEFFPFEFSPFTYNETLAHDNYPLSKEQVTERGYLWKAPEKRTHTITKQHEDLPDNIGEVTDAITSEVIACMHAGTCEDQCTYAWRILPEDLQFYRLKNVPLPRLCPNCRHYERLRKRTPVRLWHRACMCAIASHSHSGKCPNEFQTSYPPDSPCIVYCEQCYQAEVI